MKNKRYMRLAKKMKAYCTGCCNGGEETQCKYYYRCFNKHILLPKCDNLKYLEDKLKGQVIKY